MAVVKCKLCQNEFEITKETEIVECQYCGTKLVVSNESSEVDSFEFECAMGSMNKEMYSGEKQDSSFPYFDNHLENKKINDHVSCPEDSKPSEDVKNSHEKEITPEESASNKKVVPIMCLVLAFAIICVTVIVPSYKRKNANGLLDEGQYESAYSILEDIDETEDIKNNKYERANELLESGDKENALELFEQIENYKDSAEKISEIKYEFALSHIDSGNYVDAYETLIEIRGYKDSKEKASDILFEYQEQKLKTAEVGDYILFGLYEQDNNTSNGKENIEWLVYEVTEDGCVFAISKYVLDLKQYNSSFSSVTWAESKVRYWLNKDFYDDAFSIKEKNSMIEAWISADPDSGTYTIGNNSTTFDKVYLMSNSDAQNWFGSAEARKCKPTKYAEYKNHHSVDDNGYCSWILLSPGKSNSYVSYVDSDGSVNDSGISVYTSMGVRPAIIIDTNKFN